MKSDLFLTDDVFTASYSIRYDSGQASFVKMLAPNVSDRGDSNARPLRPERSALPTALLSDCGAKLARSFGFQGVLGDVFWDFEEKK